MKLGVHLHVWDAGPPPAAHETVMEAERLGFDSVWAAEAWGSDALTPLAWWGASTKRIRLGTGVAQLSARAPSAAAMAAITLDHLSGGRFLLGLGVSGPQVVEGWYGAPFSQPLARTREYVDIVRRVLARNGPVTASGPHYPLPCPGGTGLGRPLQSIVHPLRADLPIVLGAEGPKNVALTAEIADGWIPAFFAPKDEPFYRRAMAEGFARPNARRNADTFETLAMVPVVFDDDVERAADAVRPLMALYIGGMGHRSANFHFDVFVRMGFEAEAVKIQELYQEGRQREAVAAVPTSMVEEIALIGPSAKIRADLEKWEASLVTTLLMIKPKFPDLRRMADLML